VKFSLYKQVDIDWHFIISSDLAYSIDFYELPQPLEDEIVKVGFSFGIINDKIRYRTKKWFYVTDFVTKIVKQTPYEIIFVAGYQVDNFYKLSISNKKERLSLREWYGLD
jgi:hypothetical protein